MKKTILLTMMVICVFGMSALDFQLGGGYTAAVESSAPWADNVSVSNSSYLYPAGINLYGGVGVSLLPILAVGAEYEYVALLDVQTDPLNVSVGAFHSPKAYLKVELPILVSASVLAGADFSYDFSEFAPTVGVRAALFNFYAQYTASFDDSIRHRAALGFSLFK